MSADELERICEETGKPFDAALRLVRRLVDGVERDEAVAIVCKVIGGVVSENGATVENALQAINARRKEVAKRLDGIDAEKKALKSEERKLNQAATALRKVTGEENREFYCDECELPFASRQGLNSHKTKMHKKAQSA